MNLGILYLSSNPLEAIPPARLRALLAEAYLQGANLRVLIPGSFNFEAQSAEAYCWSRSEEKWRIKYLPIPELIIFQGAVKTSYEKQLREWCLTNRTTIADTGLNKRVLAEVIKTSKYKELVIPTQRLEKAGTMAQIKQCLDQWQGAVIKRENSNRGIGLLFIQKNNDQWCLSHEQKSFYGGVAEIVEKAYKLIKGRLAYRNYIIQPFIKAKTNDQRPVDIRVHLQKRLDGRWHCTRAYARVAEACSNLPNYSKGGYQGDLMSFLQKVVPDSYTKVRDLLIETAIGVASTQDSMSQPPLSELGLDFLFDVNDKLWLIETNTWPQSALHEMERAKFVIEYSRFLNSTSRKHAMEAALDD